MELQDTARKDTACTPEEAFEALVVGRTADPPVGAFVGHYRCLACRRDFVQGLAGDPEKGREFLEEMAAWPERHRPSRRVHRL